MRFNYVFVAVSSLIVGACGNCSNNPSFLFYHEGTDLSCADLGGLGSKDFLCKDPFIARACAESCDSCSNKNQTKTSSSANAAAAISKPHYVRHGQKEISSRSLKYIASCANDDSYHLPREPDHDCRWIKSTEAFRQKFCQSKHVQSKCSISCGECCEDDSLFSFYVEVEVNAPVSSPSKGSAGGSPTKGSTGGSPTKGSAGGSPTKGSAGGSPTKGSAGGSPTKGKTGGSPTKGKTGGSPTKGKTGGSPTKGKTGGSPTKGKTGGSTNSSPANATHQKVRKNCEWLNTNDHAEKYCKTETFEGRKVQDDCPKACNYCEGKVTPLTSTCLNDPAFYVNGNGQQYDCSWIAGFSKYDRDMYCGSNEVQKACPQSCGKCCEDDPRYKFDTHKVGEKDCAWISKNGIGLGIENWRIDEYCGMAFDDGSLASDNCPKACDMCVSSSCTPGFEGDNCQIPICQNGCGSHGGQCSSPNSCSCNDGYKGETCDVPICQNGCGSHGGQCSAPNSCSCAPGFKGETCDVPICENGCGSHGGQCSAPNSCSCYGGYKGETCDEPVDTGDLCKNNVDYVVPWGEEKGHGCLWVKSEDMIRQRYCQSNIVKTQCPFSCGECCDDNPSFTFSTTENDGKRDCNWLAKQVRSESEKYCKKEVGGRKVHDECPKACGNCQEKVTLSGACLNDVAFTVDGNNEFDCRWIRWKESRRDKYCDLDQGLGKVNEACPQSCGKCCDDDPAYKFTTDNVGEKGCAWIEKKKNTRKDAYCARTFNSRSVRDNCPKACNMCVSPISSSCDPGFEGENCDPVEVPLSVLPTKAPTKAPTEAPTKVPTKAPTMAQNIITPTMAPTKAPIKAPTVAPNIAPTKAPIKAPTKAPTVAPSAKPSAKPSTKPTANPVVLGSTVPSRNPTDVPTLSPSAKPSAKPTSKPSAKPSANPVVLASTVPSSNPTDVPTLSPSAKPSDKPSIAPTKAPTAAPTFGPCPDGEFKLLDGSCDDDACEVCTELGIACISSTGTPKIYDCLDCDCGFCGGDNQDETCCAMNGGGKNCNPTGGSPSDCDLGDFAAFSYLSGNVCGGVEVSDNSNQGGCGCKPSADAVCSYVKTNDNNCSKCTQADILADDPLTCSVCKDCVDGCGGEGACIANCDSACIKV